MAVSQSHPPPSRFLVTQVRGNLSIYFVLNRERNICPDVFGTLLSRTSCGINVPCSEKRYYRHIVCASDLCSIPLVKDTSGYLIVSRPGRRLISKRSVQNKSSHIHGSSDSAAVGKKRERAQRMVVPKALWEPCYRSGSQKAANYGDMIIAPIVITSPKKMIGLNAPYGPCRRLRTLQHKSRSCRFRGHSRPRPDSHQMGCMICVVQRI